MILSRKFVVLCLVFICSALKVSAEIADTTGFATQTLNEVVITSSKDEKKQIDLPASISLLTPKEIENWNITSIKDISTVIPNLFFPDYGSKLTSPVYIRGVGSKINAPSVGLYVDGVPYFEKSVFDFEFDEVERIEVLRGPQGSLYGRNTMGGVIHVITRNPLEHQGGKLRLTNGSYGYQDYSGSYYGKIRPHFGYSFSGKYNHSDGFIENKYTGQTADKIDVFSGTGKLVWEATPSLNFNLHLRYDNSKQNGYPYALIDPAGKIGEVSYDSVSTYNRNIISGAFVINKKFPAYQIKSVTGMQILSDLQAIDQDFSILPVNFVTQKQDQTLWTEEMEIRSIGGKKIDWLLGAFAFSQQAKSHLKINAQTKDYDIPAKGLALYHQSTWNNVVVSGLSLTAGIRYDYEKSSQGFLYQKPVSGILKTVSDLYSELSFSQWSPKFSAQFKLSNLNMVYASVTKGYKTGGFNTSFDTEAEQTFKPEYSWSYEVGSKYGFLNKKLSGEIAFFYTDWKNQQISQPLASGVGSLLRNAGQSYSKGAEYSLQTLLQKGWIFNLCYGYTEARFVNYRSGATDYSENYIPYIPRHTLMLGSDYTWTFNGKCLNRALFSLQYVETGKLFWNDQNSASQDTYGVINGKISLNRKNLTLDFWVKNAAATEYTAFYFEMSGKKYGQKGKPRTLGATLTILIP